MTSLPHTQALGGPTTSLGMRPGTNINSNIIHSVVECIHGSDEYIHSGYESSLNPQVLGPWAGL